MKLRPGALTAACAKCCNVVTRSTSMGGQLLTKIRGASFI